MIYLQGIAKNVVFLKFQYMDSAIRMRRYCYLQEYPLQVWLEDWDMQV